MKPKLPDVFWMTLGAALVSVSVYFFKFPNHFSMGGVSGLSILLGQLIHVSFLLITNSSEIFGKGFLRAQ